MSLFHSSGRRVGFAFAAGAFTLLSLPASALTLSNLPLFSAEALPANLMVALDDSGSMTWGYAPDNICNIPHTKRVKSADFNPLYYNPNVTYEAPPKADGILYATTFGKAWHNGFDQSRGSADLSTSYRATWGYNPSQTPPTGFQTPGCGATESGYGRNPAPHTTAQREIGVPAYYYVRNTSLANCTASDKNDEDCYEYKAVPTSQQQNFANWYSFYRTRNLATASAAAIAFYDLPRNTRVAWVSLNSCTEFGTNCSGWASPASNLDNRIRAFDGNHRDRFFSWVSRLPANGGTPLLQALERIGSYYQTPLGSANSPYAEDPPLVKGTEYACRQNYAVLMTDGIWNTYSISVGNLDGSSATLPDGKSYSAASPYKDSTSNTLSDLAFKLWVTDLSPLANKVPTYAPDKTGNETQQYWSAKNDPAKWQHLVTFTVGLGLGPTLADNGLVWGGDTYSGDYSKLVSGEKQWPAAGFNKTPENAADLWHAAINSRGQFFAADTPDAIVDAFKKIVDRVKAGVGSGSAATSNSTSLRSGAAVYIGSFNGADWSGDLRKVAINADGSIGADLWSAQTILQAPNASARKVFTRNGQSGVGVEFKWANLSPAQQTLLKSGTDDAGGQARLNWIRGDATNEDPSGLKFRKRNTKLGDIVGSSALRVGIPSAPISDESYYGFRLANCEPGTIGCSGGRSPVVYVGANDGMLHAFDDATGAEVFSYVPSMVYPKLYELTQQSYQHRFYVDGTPSAVDLKLNGAWANVLVGSLGAGGKGIFALNVTKPTAFSGSDVLWEFSDANDADMGYSFAKPTAAKMKNGKWAVVFGNGYNSAGGKSVLYVAFVDEGRNGWSAGSSFIKLVADSGGDNGLSSPSAVDVDADGYADYIFAGDLKGNMWKFDVNSSSTSEWKVAQNGLPLFVAKDSSNNVQPISSAPEVVKHPRGGLLVLFGTGLAVQASDVSGPFNKQTFYGVWDIEGAGALSRARLLQHSFSANVTVDGREYRSVDSATPDWWSASKPSGQLGWFVDLPGYGERVTMAPTAVNGLVVFGSGGPSDDKCEPGGYGWVNIVDAISGADKIKPPLDINGDKGFNNLDKVGGDVWTSYKLGGGYLSGTTIIENGKTSLIVTTGTGSSNSDIETGNLNKTTSRLNWRDIMR